MTIKLLFFSLLRDLAGTDELNFPLREGVSTVGGLLEELYAQYEGLASWDATLLVAVNCEYASRDTEIKDGDEVALMPPVQGG